MGPVDIAIIPRQAIARLAYQPCLGQEKWLRKKPTRVAVESNYSNCITHMYLDQCLANTGVELFAMRCRGLIPTVFSAFVRPGRPNAVSTNDQSLKVDIGFPA